MFDIAINVAIVLLLVSGAAMALLLLHRIWPSSARKEHNDLIGWQTSVTGTTYAVVLGFMLYAVWNDFQAADSNAEAEADAAVNVARCARGLPEPQRSKLQNLSAEYVDSMLHQEWPAMKQDRLSRAPNAVIESLWTTMTGTPVKNLSEQSSLNQTLAQLSALTAHRRLRHQQATSEIPSILWIVLVVGAGTVVISACMFGSLDRRIQAIQVSMLTLVLSLILIAIGDLSSPFQGIVNVHPTGFERAQATLQRAGLE